jgi:toxin CptA
MKPIATLSLSIKPSRRLLLVQLLAHAIAAVAVLASEIPPWLAAILLLLVGASLARVRRAIPACGLLLHGDGGLEIVSAGGTADTAEIHAHTLVLSFLVVLLYRQQGRLRSLTLLGDSLPAEDFRQLRLWLRWRSSVAASA